VLARQGGELEPDWGKWLDWKGGRAVLSEADDNEDKETET